MTSRLTRRRFLQASSAFAGGWPFLAASLRHPSPTGWSGDLKVHIFSKHLQFLDYPEMAETAAEIGFSGVELSVRPGGHVLPENVSADLPKAIDAVRSRGLLAEMMVTRITDPHSEVNRQVLKTAVELGIKTYRMGYFRTPPERTVWESILECRKTMQELAALNARLGIQGNYQNHAGTRVGANIWEIWHMLEGIEPFALGCQYDIRHATVEGGYSWTTGLRLIRDSINNIVIKDFRWERIDGRWQAFHTPLGEGMVDFTGYFKLLKSYGIQVPVSLHCEYDLGGAEHGDRKLKDGWTKARVAQAMKRDLLALKDLWAKA